MLAAPVSVVDATNCAPFVPGHGREVAVLGSKGTTGKELLPPPLPPPPVASHADPFQRQVARAVPPPAQVPRDMASVKI
jgi:hypothetical protein